MVPMDVGGGRHGEVGAGGTGGIMVHIGMVTGMGVMGMDMAIPTGGHLLGLCVACS